MSAVTKHKHWNSLFVRHINIDDELTDAELAAIALAKTKSSNGNHPQRLCDCPETLLHGKRVPCAPQHDCFYCRTRSGLVDQAAKNASRRVTVGCGAKIGDAANQWTRLFASEMDRLSEQLGL
jgi:hypothetical protein